LPVASTKAAADLPICTSACGITVVITGGVTLFVKFGSPIGEPALATFVMVPLGGGITAKVTLLITPLAKLPKLQIATPLFVTPPPLALTKIVPVGNASVTVTLLATDGPKFVTEIV
jgi:hypothetical protein